MSCPLIERDCPDCSGYLNIQHLDEAFGRCLDDYEHCPIFIRWSRSRVTPAEVKLAPCHGPPDRVVKLR